MSLRRIGKGWGKTIPQQWLERKRRNMANIQQKKLIGSDTITGKENTEHEKHWDSSGTSCAWHRRTATTRGCQFPAGLLKVLRVTGDSGFEEKLFLSLIFHHLQSQYQPLINRPNTGTSNIFGRFPRGRSHLLVFMALCCLWGFQVTVPKDSRD